MKVHIKKGSKFLSSWEKSHGKYSWTTLEVCAARFDVKANWLIADLVLATGGRVVQAKKKLRNGGEKCWKKA